MSTTPISTSSQQNIYKREKPFTSVATSKTTSMIKNIRKTTYEYIHQS